MPSDIERFPMVPIRDVVIFPYTKVAFKIGRPSSVMALERAMTGERQIFLATQHDASVDEPKSDEIYAVGTLGRILQAQRQDNGQIKVVVEGRERGRSVRIEQDADGMFYACAASCFDGRVGLPHGRAVAKDTFAGRAISAGFAGCLRRCSARQFARRFGGTDRGFDVVAFADRR